MTFACIPFYQRHHPAPPSYICIRLCPEKQYLDRNFSCKWIPLTAEKDIYIYFFLNSRKKYSALVKCPYLCCVHVADQLEKH